MLAYYIFESTLLCFAGLILLGINIGLKRALTIGVFHGLAVLLVRTIYFYFSIPFGTHTIILVFILSILIRLFVRVSYGAALMATLFSFILLVIGDLAINIPLMNYFHLSLDQIVHSFWLNSLFGLVSKLPLFVVVYLGVYHKFKLFDYSGWQKMWR